MKVFYLSNEHSDYVVLADDEDDAWRKLREQFSILPFGAEDAEDANAAYNDLIEVVPGSSMDNPNDIFFVF